MSNLLLARTSLFGLFRELRSDIKTFLSQEVALAKREMTEKISGYSRNGVRLVIGGFIAYAGLIVLQQHCAEAKILPCVTGARLCAEHQIGFAPKGLPRIARRFNAG